jgi:hypothetical protein
VTAQLLGCPTGFFTCSPANPPTGGPTQVPPGSSASVLQLCYFGPGTAIPGCPPCGTGTAKFFRLAWSASAPGYLSCCGEATWTCGQDLTVPISLYKIPDGLVQVCCPDPGCQTWAPQCGPAGRGLAYRHYYAHFNHLPGFACGGDRGAMHLIYDETEDAWLGSPYDGRGTFAGKWYCRTTSGTLLVWQAFPADLQVRMECGSPGRFTLFVDVVLPPDADRAALGCVAGSSGTFCLSSSTALVGDLCWTAEAASLAQGGFWFGGAVLVSNVDPGPPTVEDPGPPDPCPPPLDACSNPLGYL